MFFQGKHRCVFWICLVLAGQVGSGCGGGSGDPPDLSPWVLKVTGEEYRWVATYPGADGVFDSADDVESTGEIRVPAGRPLTLDLTSRDYLYTLAIEEFDVQQIAVPDMVFSVDLLPGRTGRFRLVGDQLCGFSHASLMADFVVVPPREFERWTARLPSTGGSRPEE